MRRALLSVRAAVDRIATRAIHVAALLGIGAIVLTPLWLMLMATHPHRNPYGVLPSGAKLVGLRAETSIRFPVEVAGCER